MKTYMLDAEKHTIALDLNKTGEAQRWGEFMQSDERIVAQTRIGDVLVSTVFLGLDHSSCKGLPILFETMVFGGPCDEDTWRYSS